MSVPWDSRPSPSSDDRLAINANWLMKLRWVAVVGQLTTIVVVDYGFDIHVEFAALLIALAITTCTNLIFTVWLRRLASGLAQQPSRSGWNRVFMALMLLDLVVLTALLFFTGGHANPFSLFYFVNLALSGILLPARRAWFLNALSIMSFAVLLYHHVPLWELQRPEILHSVHDLGTITLSQQGLLIAFATCSSVIVYFATRLTAELQRRDEDLRQSEMRQARSEKWEALGTLSAGAAHELATPLTTIAIVSQEIERELRSEHVSDTIIGDMDIIRSEIQRCRAILDRMSIDAGHATAEPHLTISPESLVSSTLDELINIGQRVQVSVLASAQGKLVNVPVQSVAMALRGVLQNALDASPEQPVTMELSSEDDYLRILIKDFGVGMNAQVLQRADEPFFTTKEAGQGMGLGRFLARTVFERLGGTFQTESSLGVGTEVVVRLPLEHDELANDERTTAPDR